MQGNILKYMPVTLLCLSPEESIKLTNYLYKESQRKIERLTNSLKLSERAFEEYKKASAKVIEHDLYVKGIRDKKKARRLKNKAKGPRK